MGVAHVVQCDTVEQACDRAVALAGVDDAVLVTGSLYVVGAARPYLRRTL
jgi:folylpolyglutamate synthase/dihydropteroate synthase